MKKQQAWKKLIKTKSHQTSSHLLALSLCLYTSLVNSGCDDDPDPVIEVIEMPDCEGRGVDDEGRCLPRTTPPHPPECLAVDGELCLINFTWSDQGPRLGALTPGEQFSIDAISVYNSGNEALILTNLFLEATSPNLNRDEPWSSSEVSGAGWAHAEEPLNRELEEAYTRGCLIGEIPPGGGCTFTIGADYTVGGAAPLNAIQRLELAAETSKGSRFTWSLPLVVVDPNMGLELLDFQLEESTEDGDLQIGDRVRFTEISLSNSTFAPFVEVTGLLVGGEGVLIEGETTEWEIGEERVSGGVTSTVSCPEARSSEELGLTPSLCVLSLPHVFTLDATGGGPAARQLTLYLRDRGLDVGGPLLINLELIPPMRALTLIPPKVESDENRDRELSPGERFRINQFIVENESAEGISLRGRVSIGSSPADLGGASDLSVNATEPRDEFYENCPPLSSCPLDVNLIGEVSEDAEFGELIEFELELLDQTGIVHELSTSLELKLPDVRFRLAEIEIQQDTLDPDLSAGERGVINYLRIDNEGEADAEEVLVTLSTESPWITFEDPSRLSFRLNTSSNEYEDQSGVCPSREYDPEGYCYVRSGFYFQISPEAPLGELVNLQFALEDRWGEREVLEFSFMIF